MDLAKDLALLANGLFETANKNKGIASWPLKGSVRIRNRFSLLPLKSFVFKNIFPNSTKQALSFVERTASGFHQVG